MTNLIGVLGVAPPKVGEVGLLCSSSKVGKATGASSASNIIDAARGAALLLPPAPAAADDDAPSDSNIRDPVLPPVPATPAG